MKKAVFKMFSVIMALCLFLGVMPITTFAESEELYYSETVEMIQFSPETELDVEPSTNIYNFYNNGVNIDTNKYFYSQLTANQKAIYEQIWAAGPVETINIDLSNISITGTGASSSESKTNAVNNVGQDVMMAITALNEDKPMFCWASGFNFAYNGSNKNSGDSYVFTLTLLSLNIILDTKHFSDFSDVQQKLDAIDAKVSTIHVNGFSRHEKLKSIHDYLADNIVYDDSISEPNIYDIYGAFINGLCVCEGYAEAFKLLCDRENIPCITVLGTGNGGAHKWNMVLMEDGKWYTLDSTWDDQESYMFYDYFLIGSGTIVPHFSSSVADKQVHIPTGKVFSSASKALSYPALSTDTYGVGMLNYDAGDVHFDKTRGVIMVGKDVKNYESSFVNYSGFSRIKNGDGTTTSTLTVSDSITSKTYLVAMRGDVDASNSVDNTDYTTITQICATTNKVDNNTAKFYAGDMNQDGAIDGFDAIAHQLYTDGTLVFD